MKICARRVTRAALALAAHSRPPRPDSAGASASQEVGSTCVANPTLPNSTALVLYTNGALTPQPNVIPAGVITRWKVQAPADQAPIAQRLVVNRQVGEQDDSKVGESALETVGPGTNEFATRVPAPEYAHVGLTGPDGALYCDDVAMDTAGIVEGAWPVGETRHFGVEVNDSVPVVAVVEPDRDNDGYGDETQDGCPQSAALPGRLPARAPRLALRGRSRARSSSTSRRRRRRKSMPGARSAGDQPKGGQSHRVGPSASARPNTGGSGGVATRIKLPLPKAVIRRLNRTPPRESLRAKVFVHSMDLAGRPSTEKTCGRPQGAERQLSRFLRTADRFSATALKFRTGAVEERRCGRIG